MRFATWEDKSQIEAICNHPSMRVWSTFDGAKPYSADVFLTAPSMVLFGEEGCFNFHCLDRGVYMAHVDLFVRGQRAVDVAKDGLRMIFTQTDCTELIAAMPVIIPQAKWFARRLGFKFYNRLNGAWPSDGLRHDIEFYRLTLDDWRKTAYNEKEGDQLQGVVP